MPDLASFFFDASPSIVQLDTLIISHPNMTREYALVSNHRDGVTVTLETGGQKTFDYYPFTISDSELSNNLDYSIEIILGDLGEIMPKEIDAIKAASGMGTRPTVVYRKYRSDDLTAPMDGPITLEMQEPTINHEGTSFTAGPRRANRNGTGTSYSTVNFPMLRGVL